MGSGFRKAGDGGVGYRWDVGLDGQVGVREPLDDVGVFQAVDGVAEVGALAEGLVAAGAEAEVLGEGGQVHLNRAGLIGETMSDGVSLVAANPDSIWFEKDAGRRLRKLYQKPTAESDACIGAPGKPAATPSSGKPAVVPAKPSPAAPVARGPN